MKCLRRLRRQALIVAVSALAISLSVTARAADSNFCVRPVSVIAADETADLARKLNSQEPIPREPYYFESSKGARYPLVWHHYSVKRPDGLNANRSLFWSFSNNYELVGPRDFFGAFGPAIVSRTGKTLLLGGAYQKTDSGEQWWRQLLLQQVDGGAIGEVDASLQNRIAEPHLAAWSDFLDGFVLSSIAWRAGQTGRVGDDRTFLLKDDGTVKPLGIERYLSIVKDLPGLGVTALLAARSLTIVTPQLEATEVARLNPGDDYGGFQALHETRDQGWLYVVGGQYDNAVRVEQTAGRWRVTSIVRITENDGWVNGIFRYLFGMTRAQIQRDNLSKVISAGTCRRYSTAAKRMFFCDNSASTADVRQELRAGEIVPIAGGSAGFKTFLGDADSLGLALFLGNDGSLYGYDGERVHHIAKASFDVALVNDVPELGRTFLVSPNALFEVRANDDGFEIIKLIAPSGVFGAWFHAAPDGRAALAFAGGRIYLITGGALKPIWSSPEQGSIDTTGGTPPTDVVGWGGILFATHTRNDRHFYLLKPCSESTK
jgi:hypothetical protein